jgi:hypothetical protein
MQYTWLGSIKRYTGFKMYSLILKSHKFPKYRRLLSKRKEKIKKMKKKFHSRNFYCFRSVRLDLSACG